MTQSELRRTLRFLREEFPPDKPVRVRQLKLDAEMMGHCYHRELEYFITLGTGWPLVDQRETLLHEWAHALAYQDQEARDTGGDHDSIYCAAYVAIEERYRERFPEFGLRGVGELERAIRPEAVLFNARHTLCVDDD